MEEIIVKAKSPEGKAIINEFESILATCGNFGSEPLYNCKAKVAIGYDYLVLYSYNTPIAIVDFENKAVYECLRPMYGYTATSNQHIQKFKKYLQHKNPTFCSYATFYSVR